MISRLDIEQCVREWGLREDVVEKDYVLGWVLWGIGSDESLSRTWVFKGGTCLKKCYLETYRFSEDLDFTILPEGPIRAAQLLPALDRVLARVSEESGIYFSQRAPLLKEHSSGNYTEGRIYFRGPRMAPKVASIILDLSASEQIIQPTVLRRIAHSYPDTLPEPATVRCYSFEEVFAEKIRAMAQRGRPRDLFDIVNLFRRPDLSRFPGFIRQVLEQKCRSKGIAVPTADSILASRFYNELESEWANMLAHQLPALPPFPDFWSEIPHLFAWLDGTAAAETLATMPTAPDEEVAWAPPPTVWTWGEGVPLESVRFAAANHLCIELGYNNQQRVVEPYSLRRTRAGKLVLHTVKVETREPRSYRVDRIQSIRVTGQVFKPVYQIEFTSTGAIEAPRTTSSRPTRAHRSSRSSGSSRPRRLYVVRCPICGRDFQRVSSDLTLNAHDNEWKQPCPGKGRRGILIDTRYE